MAPAPLSITVQPYPLTNLSATSPDKTLSIVDMGSYYDIESVVEGENITITISADGYQSQTIQTGDSSIDITLIPNTPDISKLSNGTNTYIIRDDVAREAITNKQDTLVSGTNIKTINNTSILGSGNIDIQSGGNSIIPYGESTTAAATVQKEVTISSIISLNEGQIIIVKPTITSTVADSTLKLNNFSAYPMRYGTAAITTSTDSIVWTANYPSWFRFDGEYWVFLGHGIDNNTTYSTMSVAEGTTGTASSNRSLQARYLKQIIQGTTLTGLSTSTSSAVVATDTITEGIGKLQAQIGDIETALHTINSGS